MIDPVRHLYFSEVANLNKTNKTRILVEAAMMISLSTVLSIFKIIDLPYGGSVTAASMLPMIILSYRYGTLWGLSAGAVFAALQQLLGLNTLSYVTGWQSVVAVIMLDYMVAFTVVGLGGVFRRTAGSQKQALIFGALLVTVLRYLCHVVSGFTVWRDISIPESAALVYSIGYNATYMIPEGIILAAAAAYLGGALDFSKQSPTRLQTAKGAESPARLLIGLILLLVGAADVWLIAPHLQNPETGEFYFAGLTSAPWIVIGALTVGALILGAVLYIAEKKKRTK